ncbi:MAG: helix-turn-helix domain-containing protein [Desulfobacterales bacterium]|nr:helix-turn-helix domain-containing protein [Desulfobacterales bacterium]
MTEKIAVTSGVDQLDIILGNLFIGDNVVWYDDSGSLASAFCHNFIKASQEQQKPIIYVSFDRSPKNLIDKLNSFVNNPMLVIIDCFTNGKGGMVPVFSKFYDENKDNYQCQIIKVENPKNPENVTDVFYEVHEQFEGDVRFVFESITGMQKIWGGEEQILNFYSHSCARLYELNTIAYWVMEKKAHSQKLKAQINQIAQVAIELSIKKGTTSLMILKAEQRNLDVQHKPYNYSCKDINIVFESEKIKNRIDIGKRLKDLRSKNGISQTEIARLIGVTPSNISQIEKNLIYPSLPALLKIAEVLSVEINSFFQEMDNNKRRIIFSQNDVSEIKLPSTYNEVIKITLLTPIDFETQAEPYLIEMEQGASISSHFFMHKGDEFGYVLSGKVKFQINNYFYTATKNNTIYLASEIPTSWENIGDEKLRLLWTKIK